MNWIIIFDDDVLLYMNRILADLVYGYYNRVSNEFLYDFITCKKD